MPLLSPQAGLLLVLCTTTFAIQAQAPGDVTVRSESADHRILLKYGSFDPLLGTLEAPGTLRSAADTNLWIVQFPGPAIDADREAIRSIGGTIVQYMPNDGYVVRMSGASAASCAVLKEVRWVGPYHPAYRVEAFLFQEHVTGAVVPVRKYNMVMADKRGEKNALQAKIQAIGGKVTDRHDGGLLFTAELTGVQMLLAARFDEVLWIERWTAPELDMNNARTTQGADIIEGAAGYTGIGIRGHVYEGVEAAHPDFTTAMTNVRSSGAAQDHGHCTAGCIFGNGNSAAQARGMAPGAVGFYTNYLTVTGGWSRNAVIGDVVNVHSCMFTTASWGGGVTSAYTAVSADADDIVFDHRIPWTQSMSNQNSTLCRPEAWAKNVISIGGMFHRDDAVTGNDAYTYAGQPFQSASRGPAQDGRLKPDLSNFYEDVWTSDLSGTAGYNNAAGVAGNSTTGFNGTSSATPITAGTNALAIQMYTDSIFNNAPRVSGGTRFQNRPYAQTLKALQIACASIYPLAQGTRAQAGWGLPALDTMYNRRARMTIIPEDVPITQGATHTYVVNVLNGETSLKVCMSYLDPQGNVAAAIDRINDLTLRVIHPNGTTSYWGNNGLTAANVSSTGGAANTLDTVENVILANPAAGDWTIEITAPIIAQDAHLATGGVDATYALVVNGGIRFPGSGCARYIPDTGTTGTINTIPFGTAGPSSLPTVFANNNGGGVGGAIYFDITPTTNLYLCGLDLNSSIAAASPMTIDVYTRVGTFAGNEGNIAAWSARTAGHGTAAGTDLPSIIHLNETILLGANITYGIAVVARNFNHSYTNGTGTNQNYSDANMAIACGSATNAPFNGSPFSPRVANMNVKYRTDTSAWGNQRYQTILRMEQLGSAGSIRGLGFSPSTTGRHYNHTLQIQMSHVPAGHTLSTTFATNLPSPVTVLNAPTYSWHTTADTWNEIGLQNSFAYNGTSDVVVDIIAVGNHDTVPGGFNRGALPRAYAFNWASGSTPTIATGTDNAGQRIRVNFNCAVGSEYGTSCGPLRALHFGTPNRGGTAWYDVYDALPSSGVIIGLGFTGIPSPLSLTGFGFTNCIQWHDLSSTLFKVTDATGFATHAISVPNSAIYDGLKIRGQWFALDPAQPGGLTVSNYITNLIGIDP